MKKIRARNVGPPHEFTSKEREDIMNPNHTNGITDFIDSLLLIKLIIWVIDFSLRFNVRYLEKIDLVRNHNKNWLWLPKT